MTLPVADTQTDERTDILTWLELLNPRKVQAGVAARPPRIPTRAEYDLLVDEAALGYFTEAELCKRFQCTREVLKEITSHPQFEADVMARRKQLDESDTGLRAIARREVRQQITKLTDIIEGDEEGISYTAKVKAFEQLRHVAGLGANDTGGKGGPPVALSINTNLGVGHKEDGRYVIEARADEKGDDFMDLLT